MTSTAKEIFETKIKKLIPFFVIGKLAIFAGFLLFMMQG